MRVRPLMALAAWLLTTGCHSAYIETTITNHTAQPIVLLEVDYPSASFGTQNLLPGESFRYRFKILGAGSTKLLYTDASHNDHTSSGPPFVEGQEGRLAISIEDTTAKWQFDAKPH